MKKTLVSLAVTAMLGVGGVASAGPIFSPFTVTTADVPGAPIRTFEATSITGGYNERVAISQTGAVAAAAVANLTSFFTGPNGTAVINGSNGGPTGLNNNYGLYAIFTSTAQVIGPNDFAGIAGRFDLYMDPNFNTDTFSLTSGVLTAGMITTAPSASATFNTSDDYLLASSTVLRPYPSSFGNLNNPPSFEFVFDALSLTTGDLSVAAGTQNGKTFFIAPSDFYMTVIIDGTVLGLTTSPNSLQNVSGTLQVSFTDVPEPGSLALVGLGLAGLGLIKRRRTSIR